MSTAAHTWVIRPQADKQALSGFVRVMENLFQALKVMESVYFLEKSWNFFNEDRLIFVSVFMHK